MATPDYPIVHRWSEEEYGPLSLEAVKRRYSEEGRYRVSYNRYDDDHKDFAERAREGWCYVLSGEITFSWDDPPRRITLKAGEYVLLPEGEHDIQLPPGPVELVRVWDLHKLMGRETPQG